MTKAEFVVRYVLNRAKGVSGTLSGSGATVDAENAWEKIKVLSGIEDVNVDVPAPETIAPHPAMSMTCIYCPITDDSNACGGEHSSGLVCTRHKGHEGDHVSCSGPGKHYIQLWPSED